LASSTCKTCPAGFATCAANDDNEVFPLTCQNSGVVLEGMICSWT